MNVALLDCGIIEDFKRSRSLKIIEKINALGFEIERVQVLKGEKLSQEVSHYSHIIVSGSGLDFDSEELGIEYIREVILEVKKLNVLLLGVCFGAQVLADVLGGEVIKKENAEFGFVTVSLIDVHKDFENLSKKDIIFNDMPDNFDVFEYHFDYIKSLPKEFSITAKSKSCIQGFSYSNFYGVQFHPEVDGEFAQREVEIISNKQLVENVKSAYIDYSLPSKIFENFLNINN